MSPTSDSVDQQRQFMQKLAHMRMPFGRYTDQRLMDLPERYLVWFKQKGFPEGELGKMLAAVYEIKLNGLEYLFREEKLNGR